LSEAWGKETLIKHRNLKPACLHRGILQEVQNIIVNQGERVLAHRLTNLSHPERGLGHWEDLLQCHKQLILFSVSKRSRVGGGCCHDHSGNDSFSLKCNPWEILPVTCFISYLRFLAHNIFVYIFTKSHKFFS
jgi:hypothetical protein